MYEKSRAATTTEKQTKNSSWLYTVLQFHFGHLCLNSQENNEKLATFCKPEGLKCANWPFLVLILSEPKLPCTVV